MGIAFLGTGLLGSGFVQHLLATHESVAVWNRTAARAEPFAAAGARIASSPADAVAGADRVHLCLKDDAAVDQVLAAALPAAPAGAVIVDHTTTSAGGAAARGAALAGAGRAFLHAPVFMSPAAARDAKGMMMVAGPEADFRRVEPALASMTGDLWYVGADLHRAAAFKLLGNSMLIALAGALADTFALGRALGVPAEETHGLISRLKPGGAIDIRGKRMADGDFAATFELAMARKDLGIMLDALGDAPLSALRGIAARADQLIARGHGADDLGVLAVDAVGPVNPAAPR
ncbi:MAG TPA: NAD(P)-binding domain-containing protein [Kofleriaceae bacterium]|nr:NAD(P)-binding domain-containing protein [Kofleriaceae bacterium]